MADQIEIPSGIDDRVVHVWNSDGLTWACAAYDHGPMCRLCQRVDEITWELLGCVKNGLMDVKAAPDGTFSFKLTAAGEDEAARIRATDPEMAKFYDDFVVRDLEQQFDEGTDDG